MGKILKILRNRNVLLIFSIALRLAWGDGVKSAEKTVLPATGSTIFMIAYIIWLSLKEGRG